MLDLTCYLVAVVLFILTAVNVPARIKMLAAGLAFAFFPLLVSALHHVG